MLSWHLDSDNVDHLFITFPTSYSITTSLKAKKMSDEVLCKTNMSSLQGILGESGFRVLMGFGLLRL